MNTNESKKKKAKKVKTKTLPRNNSQGSRPPGDSNINDLEEPCCPLIAKDSEWVDILQTPHRTMSSESTEEVESEDGRETKPLAIMFPGLLAKDPQTLQNMLTKAMSTTEVTKHLVDLGQKANFKYMKKSSRLIPLDKEWLESVSEVNTGSHSSMGPGVSGSSNSNNDSVEDTEAKK
ncbi:uncharacterized protein LOC133517727 isoform X2 [Cydia pomonella]|uniref:uncharacterized protein LOC133517727 isoform X2 n=1 Tax=Cydia pomonella TaxID=82600 RepID=UPI002ADDF2C1|nr:uncharacterized protein LOC133517727 isoform X2 [Cydia pomonella]